MKKLILLTLLTSLNTYAASMKDMVTYLASDSLEGRKPGKPGNEMALDYIEKQVKDIGLSPLGDNHRQEFTIFTEMVKNGDNLFVIDSKVDALFQPISFSLSKTLTDKQLVFAGFGISIPIGDQKIVYDDYQGIDVKDKIVIIMSGDPGIGNINSPFRDPAYISYRSLFYKLKNAISHGAAGAIIINDPLSLENYPEEEAPYFNTSEGGGHRFSIVVGRSTNKFINTFLGPISTLAIQKKISKTQKPFSLELNNKANLSVQLSKKTGRVANIVGMIEGSDPKYKKEVIVIGAHMDHLGHGGESSMDPVQDGKIHHGADDNASGTAFVLNLASELKKSEHKRTYVFVLFNAEEMGLLGSSHFVSSWARYESSYGKLIAMLNYDMVGRYQKDISVMGTASAKEWRNIVPAMSSQFHYVLKESALGSSDHASFIKSSIPSLFFTTGAHEDYHRSTDTEDKIDYTAMKSLTNYSQQLISKLDSSNIEFDPSYSNGDQGGSRGYGAHLGCVPKFGQSEDIVGVVCSGVSKASPAQNAGVLAQDIIVQIGEIEIKTIYDLAFALKFYRAGDEIELGWKRGDQLFKQMITLAKSRRHLH